MLGGRWRTNIARCELKYGAELLVDIAAPGKSFALLERNPGTYFQSVSSLASKRRDRRTLVFSIPTLDLLMQFLLNLAFENSCASGFVEASGFQDMCRINPVIMASAHNCYASATWQR